MSKLCFSLFIYILSYPIGYKFYFDILHWNKNNAISYTFITAYFILILFALDLLKFDNKKAEPSEKYPHFTSRFLFFSLLIQLLYILLMQV